MQRFVDNVLAVTKDGVSSFNKFIHELSVDSDTSSEDYSSAEEDIDGLCPASPLSQNSQFSHANSFTKNTGYWTGWPMFLLSWILFPVRFLLGLPLRLCHLFYSRDSATSSVRGRRKPSRLCSFARVHRTTDRRRGVIEDLHLAIEMFIESIFDFFHKAAHFLLSPSEVKRVLYRWFSSQSRGNEDTYGLSDACVPTATLGENDPTLTERKTTFHQSLNTDARTCQDVITELGYPYEAIRVITSDGYVLLLERIPRRDSRKAVYLQHGILDSSMGLCI